MERVIGCNLVGQSCVKLLKDADTWLRFFVCFAGLSVCGCGCRWCRFDSSEVFFLNPNLETGWRLTRVCYMLSVTAAGQHEQNYLNDGWGAAQKYLKMEGGEEHPDARKWAGIILGSVADFYKPKEKVAASQEIRQHLEACLAVNPGDSAAQHAMGMYCFNVAGIGCVFVGDDVPFRLLSCSSLCVPCGTRH